MVTGCVRIGKRMYTPQHYGCAHMAGYLRALVEAVEARDEQQQDNQQNEGGCRAQVLRFLPPVTPHLLGLLRPAAHF